MKVLFYIAITLYVGSFLWRRRLHRPPLPDQILVDMKHFTDAQRAALIFGVLVIIAALLISGRYTITQQGHMAYVVDRFTGAVRFCTREECVDFPTNGPRWKAF
jgi:hypothetical protein